MDSWVYKCTYIFMYSYNNNNQGGKEKSIDIIHYKYMGETGEQ